MFLLNSRMGRFAAPPGIAPEDPFSRSYGVMLPSSLTRFLPRAWVFLHPPTCVGFGTAGMSVSDVFSGKRGRAALKGTSPLSVRQFPAVPGLTVGPGRCPSPNVRLNPPCWCRNVDLPSIGYAFRPGLRCRLTPGGRTCPGKPWDSGDRDSHPVFRYSCPHNRWWTVHGRLRAPLRPCPPRSPTAPPEGGAREFGIALTPDHFRRGVSRVVSCYALFKWWLPLSQHPTCPRDFTALVT